MGRKRKFSINSETSYQEDVQTITLALISHASKVILKVLQPRYVNQELSDVQYGFRKDGIEIKLPTSIAS